MVLCSAVRRVLLMILLRIWVMAEVRALAPLSKDNLTTWTAEPISPTVLSHKSQRSPSADYTWAMNRAYEVGPKRIITTDKHDRSIDSDTSSLRVAGKWGERAKLQPLSPSEWIGSNVLAKKAFLGGARVSPVESENRSPLNTSSSSSSSSSSPVTPRPRPISANNHPWAKPGGDLDAVSGSDAIPEVPEAELLTEYRRRPRSASEPRSFLASPIETFRHSGTVPSTPTEYIIPIPDLDSGPKSSQTISPPPRQSSLSSQMPDDVYFTAAGRRESRMYISPDAGPNYIPPSSPMRRGHAHSSSVPLAVIPADPNQKSPAMRYATWSGSKKEPTSGRPFENLMRGEEVVPPVGGDSTPVSRKEEMWSGNWNRDDIQDVIRELRSLK